MPKIVDRPKCYIGIDPGQSGGIARRMAGVDAVEMPPTMKDIYDWLYYQTSCDCFAVIEKVHSMPKQGVASAFTFGKGYGGLLMALTAAKIPHEEVDPRRWQKALGITPRKNTEDKREFKNRLKGFAQRLFPSTEMTLDTCDAILISEYCRRYREGKL